MGKRILIVEDEEDIIELMSYTLRQDGYEIDYVKTGEEAIKAVVQKQPDLVLLDLMLPGLDGGTICKHIRQDAQLCKIPVMMVTAKSEDSDIVQGLEVGADDYLVKPFSPRVLRARVKALLRRDQDDDITQSNKVLSFKGIVLDAGKHEVIVEGEPVYLTHSEFLALTMLMSNPGWVFSRYQLISAIHGDEHVVTDRTVDVMVVSLRKKLGKAASLVETVRGVGYRLKSA